MLAGMAGVCNNDRLPVVVYRGALDGKGEDAAKRFEALFAEHGWPPDWRDAERGWAD